MKGINYFQPFSVDINLMKGIMDAPDNRVVRTASSMRGHYADESALEKIIREQGDPIHYEVFEKIMPQEYGHLCFGISRLQPGLVGEECFMTKGHYHSILETAEIYLCLGGEGYLVMKTQNGDCAVEYMKSGRLVYVPPCWAHRSVNTGEEELILLFIYPAEAGHNYGDIEKEGFPKRIFKRAGKVVIE
ncbi:glucose-6-phosphate isomerase [Candidatus Sumerlaeota bacterium]|nr:glucose-6-phosphate isomerase [Candidatus Sumerlaeota bacterium]